MRITGQKNYRKTNYPTLNFEVVGEEASGRVDYAIKKIIDVVNEELVAITEGKQKDFVAGFVTKRTNASHHTNTRKKKRSMISTIYMNSLPQVGSIWLLGRKATNQYFLLYTPERIYCSKSDYSHRLPSEGILDDDTKLRQGVKEVMGVIVDLLKDRVEVGDSPDRIGVLEEESVLRHHFAGMAVHHYTCVLVFTTLRAARLLCG
ncbi:hypothetical protein RhiirB3_470656 [Rhizophagus irregularis]|nr:hypothetical protein RhiirB3_470656 [Rhizophagus irregularis]